SRVSRQSSKPMHGVSPSASAAVECRYRRAAGSDPLRATQSRRSEWVPGRPRGAADVGDVGSEPQADARTNRRHDDGAVGDEGGTDAADEIGRSIDTGEA